jgi:hypothetical protein
MLALSLAVNLSVLDRYSLKLYLISVFAMAKLFLASTTEPALSASAICANDFLMLAASF